VIAGLVILLAIAIHRPVLWSAARALTTDSPAGSATAILLLSGDRGFALAAEWVRKGAIGRVLLFQTEPGRLASLGILPAPEEISRRELVWGGVPEPCVSLIPGRSCSDWHRVRLLNTWLQAHPSESAVIFCDRFESRREAFILDCELEPSLRGRVSVAGLRDRRYDESNWWRSTPGIKAFFGAALHLASARLCGEESPRPALLSADAYEKAALQ
jgi:hypothetical protein